MKNTAYNVYILLCSLMLCMINQSCSAKLTNDQRLENHINKHSAYNIKITENGKTFEKRIFPLKIDSLSQKDMDILNIYLSNLKSSFPKQNNYIFIAFYPGKDLCNSTGNATRNNIGESNNRFQESLLNRKHITYQFIYKSSEGLDRWNKGIEWKFDKNQVIENTFFEYHYPCSSYVILHKSGKYHAYYGESSNEIRLQNINLFMDLTEDNQLQN